jgi:hypothetical protein
MALLGGALAFLMLNLLFEREDEARYSGAEAKPARPAPSQKAVVIEPTFTLTEAQARAEASLDCRNVGEVVRFERYDTQTGTWRFVLTSRAACDASCTVTDPQGRVGVAWSCERAASS